MPTANDDVQPHQEAAPIPHRLAGRTLGLVLGGLRRLPAWLSYLLADACAVPLVLASWLREKRVGRGVNRNLRIVYRDKLTPSMARRMRWAWARHITWMAVDFSRMPSIDKTNLDRFVDVGGLEDLRARCGSSGMICVTGHIGVPELLGHVASLSDMAVSSVFRPHKMRPVNDLLTRIRAAGGQKILLKWLSLWPLKKALDRGEFIGLAADEYTTHKPVFVPFLGTLAATSAAPAHLHLSTGAPMAVVSVHRVARKRYRFHVWDVIQHAKTDDWDADVEAVLRRMNEALSRAILSYPAQWFWGARRYRVRPPQEVLGADGLPPPARARGGEPAGEGEELLPAATR